MEIRNLNAFLHVAAMKSFTKAAEALGYSQSGISLQIHQLEEEIGMPLFDRIGKRADLTQYGHNLIPYAQQIVSTAAQISTLYTAKEQLGGILKVGFTESLFETLFRDTILRYHAEYPNITVEVTVDATTELLKMLRSGQLDFVCLIDSYVVSPDFRYMDVKPCSIVIVANPKHPCAKKKDLKIQDLNEQEFILMENTAPYILNFEHLLFNYDIQIRAFLKIQSPEMALKLVAQQNYLSVLPDYSVKNAINRGEVAELSIPEFSQTQTIQFLIHKNRIPTPQLNGFLQTIKAIYDSQTT